MLHGEEMMRNLPAMMLSWLLAAEILAIEDGSPYEPNEGPEDGSLWDGYHDPELDTLPDDGEHADHDSLGSASVATTEPEQTPDPVTVEDQTWFQKYKSCLM